MDIPKQVRGSDYGWSARKAVIQSISVSVIYATIRYNLCKGMAWADWPLFIANKAAALAALILLATFAIRKCRGHEKGLMGLMSAAFSLSLLHVAISLGILNPAYFSDLFDQGRLTAKGGLVFMSGAVCIVGFYRRWLLLPRLSAVLAFHVLLLGYAKWSAPADWPGYLPPITLLSFLLAILVLAAEARSWHRNRGLARSGPSPARLDPDHRKTGPARISPRHRPMAVVNPW